MSKTNDIEELTRIANELRIDIIEMLHKSGSGHPGGSLSAIDILTALYFSRMSHSPGSTNDSDHDIFILSKGHAAPAVYAALAKSGYFDKSHLGTLRQIDSILSGHPYSQSTPGIEVTTGSLGQGLSMANGIAIARKLDRRSSRVFCMMGDGEIQEGQIWEAAMTSAHYKLDNVVGILDNNGLQIDGFCHDIMSLEPIGDKWRAFGWEVIEINGHDMSQILDSLDEALTIKYKPTLIWAHTVKGKGVSFMENVAKYHGTTPTDEELQRALLELTASGN
ncbi:MAG TPA: transketolase [Nitrospinota bacterium]|nr:transketolase [Nitrospinota bacterium]|tara:strand:- start:25660 stop:26493 length:834 start_codon:yes stop_codon:yes gene_type:complete